MLRCAFVSTKSITQGEQVDAVWRPLFERFGIHIDFAYRNFKWDSGATLKAQVRCVIIGFSSSIVDNKQKIHFRHRRIILWSLWRVFMISGLTFSP